LTHHGIVLGVLPQIELPQHEVMISPGDVLLFYTDGVTEALTADFEEFGEERLQTAVTEVLAVNRSATAQEILKAVRQAIRIFTGNAPQHDDFTLFVVKRE
jgi:sigma-B regulation protein RsbU (phosphoserine phosphatase)